MQVTEKIAITSLFECYSKLLSAKQIEIFEYYYFEDYSINEIADLNEITKNAVYNTLKRTEKQLHDFEEKIGHLKLKQEFEEFKQQH
ncbi:MAG: YlxM family DNA-binding protein [Mycoplasmatales bacterium]